ncbi:adenylate kinase family protein [[Mycoplasma] collis]|uniref:adenylate kinase family protein n=1 Tax=[Mycoplasma] collis TaxID=2127 RepID=UPI00051BF3E5|nr:nucleoside monophosphate kinase [[Mycoplasma] collis]
MIKKVSKNLIFLGAPGSGKGTLASALAKVTNLIHLSTGDIFRKTIQAQTPLGLELKSIVEKGFYVPDSITNKIVEEQLNDLNKNNKNFILDGYPRTVNQAEFLATLATSKIAKVILLDVAKDVIIQRLTKRRYCPKCQKTYHLIFKPSTKGELCEIDNTPLAQRQDDQEQAIFKRLEIYESETKVLVEFYKSKNLLVTLDASDNPEKLVDKVLEIINNG